MNHPPAPAEPDPTAPMPPYQPGLGAAAYTPGQASVPAYPPGYAAVPEPAETGYLPEQPYPPGYPTVAPRRSSQPWLAAVIIAATLLVLCFGAGAVALVALRGTLFPAAAPTTGPGGQPTSPVEPSAPEPTPETPRPTTPPAEPGPSGETFNMNVGDTVIITEGANEWRVTITNMQWRDTSCGGVADPDGRLLVADVRFEVVRGRASINPLYFTWVDSDGDEEDTFSGLFTGCAEPNLDSGNNLRAGARRSGRIAFDVTASTKGTIVYEEFLDGPQASWVAPPP